MAANTRLSKLTDHLQTAEDAVGRALRTLAPPAGPSVAAPGAGAAIKKTRYGEHFTPAGQMLGLRGLQWPAGSAPQSIPVTM